MSIMNNEVTHNGERWSNAEEDRIEIVEYNSEWPNLFRSENKLLLSMLPSDIDVTIKHFGSTAIPGMEAKPIIDILLICEDQGQWNRLIKPLESLDYIFWKDNPKTDRMFFVKGMPPYGNARTHHVHVRQEAKENILFRNYMRQHPKEMLRYSKLKRELMNRYETDRKAYTNGKNEYIKSIVAKAEIWGLTNWDESSSSL